MCSFLRMCYKTNPSFSTILLIAAGLLLVSGFVEGGPMLEDDSREVPDAKNIVTSSTSPISHGPQEDHTNERTLATMSIRASASSMIDMPYLYDQQIDGERDAASSYISPPYIVNDTTAHSVPVPEHLSQLEQPYTAERLIDELLESMSLEQKAGQMIISWIDGTVASTRTKKLITETMISGVILYESNMDNSEQIIKLTDELQELSTTHSPYIGLFIGVDQEGGRVSRLRPPEVISIPSASIWGDRYDSEFVESLSYVINRELIYHGINLNFSPVLDLSTGNNDSSIGDRSISSDPLIVAELGIAYLEGASRAGVLVSGKHFPGHGMTTIDSHMELPVLDHDMKDIGPSLLPFRKNIEAGLPAIMTAHLHFPRIDPELPATFSPIIMRDLLRGDLGFSGVLISDAVEMRAISDHYNPREVAQNSINAGVDLILLANHWDAVELHAEIVDLVKSGQIAEALVDEGVRRVLRAKLDVNLIREGKQSNEERESAITSLWR